MGQKEKLLSKLMSVPTPVNFTTRELDSLMNKCGCIKFSGGRGSGIGYVHNESKRIIIFDAPHPGNELHKDHIKKIIRFLKETGEV